MNRITCALAVVALLVFNVVALAQTVLDRTFVADQGEEMTYRLWLPPGHDQQDRTFPMFVHTSGRSRMTPVYAGLQAASQSEQHASFILDPMALTSQGFVCRGPDECPNAGRSWEVLLQLIDELDMTYSIDPAKRVAFGYSAGGIAAFEAFYKNPDVFSAVISVAGGWAENYDIPHADGRLWVIHGHSDPTLPPGFSRWNVREINAQGGSAIYQELDADHSIPGHAELWVDPDNELYSWILDGVEPPLAQLLYDPATGSVEIDANSAPGGIITSFTLLPHTPLWGEPVHFQPTTIDNINGVPIDSSESAIQWSSTAGFSGVVDLGNILPSGLDFFQLHDSLQHTVYRSPTVTDTDRVFVLGVVPEPPGDFNGDNVVDGKDFLYWQTDPSVGELSDWQANYGYGTLTSSSMNVPEPAAVVLALAVLSFSIMRHRQLHQE